VLDLTTGKVLGESELMKDPGRGWGATEDRGPLSEVGQLRVLKISRSARLSQCYLTHALSIRCAVARASPYLEPWARLST